MIDQNCNHIIGLYILFFLISSSACENKDCYKIRTWEEQKSTGKKLYYIDTLEFSKEYSKMKQLNILLNIDTIDYLLVDSSIYSVESSNSIIWQSDTFKVVRILKDGNLTFFYSKFGVLMTFSKGRRTELKSVENSCTKKTIILKDFIEEILNDTILRPIYEREDLKEN